MGGVLIIILLLFTVAAVLSVRLPVDSSAPMVTLVATREMEETAVFPTQSPPANQIEGDGVQIPCDPNEHQAIRDAK